MGCAHGQYEDIGDHMALCNSCHAVLYYDDVRDPFHQGQPTINKPVATKEDTEVSLFERLRKKQQENEGLTKEIEPDNGMSQRRYVDWHSLTEDQKQEIITEAKNHGCRKTVEKYDGLTWQALRAYVAIEARRGKSAGNSGTKHTCRLNKKVREVYKPEDLNPPNNSKVISKAVIPQLPPFDNRWDPTVQCEWLRQVGHLMEVVKS